MENENAKNSMRVDFVAGINCFYHSIKFFTDRSQYVILNNREGIEWQEANNSKRMWYLKRR
jgi:hypothetical protein